MYCIVHTGLTDHLTWLMRCDEATAATSLYDRSRSPTRHWNAECDLCSLTQERCVLCWLAIPAFQHSCVLQPSRARLPDAEPKPLIVLVTVLDGLPSFFEVGG